MEEALHQRGLVFSKTAGKIGDVGTHGTKFDAFSLNDAAVGTAGRNDRPMPSGVKL